MKYLQFSLVVLFITLSYDAPIACLDEGYKHKLNHPIVVSGENKKVGVKGGAVFKRQKKTPMNFDLRLPEASIYYQGWLRYYHYSTMEKSHIKIPKMFFQNNRYFHQRIKKPKQKKKDRYGYRAIPNKAAYFGVLYNNTLAVFDGRDDIISRQVDALPVEYIGDIPEDDILRGSIRNMGEFPVGSCLDIMANIPQGFKSGKIPAYWNVCFRSPQEKDKFMKILIKLRVHYQRKKSPIPITKRFMNMGKANPMAAALNGKVSKGMVKSTVLADGYWIMLQDWTDCTLKCGGGKSYQQWMCVPPKAGGRPCQGKSVRTRPCNIQPCPIAAKILEGALQKDKHVRKPLIKVGRFSARPQKFSKCLMKENDAFLTDIDREGNIKKKIPVRLLMNNQTVSIFQDDQYEDLLYSYQLEKTQFASVQTYCCFAFQDNQKQQTFCGYPENCGIHKEKNEWAKKWEKDYYLFKVLCKTGKQESMLTEEDLKGIENPDLGNPDGIGLDDVIIRKRQLREQMHEEQTKLFRKSIARTQEVGFKAIERELNVEGMVKKEEQAKEEYELGNLENRVKKEQKKAACIHKSIEEKDYDDDYDDKMEAIEEMQRLKLKINQKVADSRNRIKKLISKMRKKAARKKADLEQKLKGIRSKMAKEILLANKEGDIRNCMKGKKDLDFRENYCNQNFVEDYVNNSACKSNEDFCYTCCEHEFGSTYRGKRNHCYKICDEKEKPKDAKKQVQLAKGPAFSWLWAPQQKVKNTETSATHK